MNDYKPGDRVTLEHEDGSWLAEREVDSVHSVLIGKRREYVNDLTASGWRVVAHVPKQEALPTAAGYYLSALPGDWIFRLDDAGDWTLLNTNSLFPIRDGHLREHAPFTRLVVEP